MMHSKDRTPDTATFRWSEAGAERQSFAISVKHWRFTVSPYFASNGNSVGFEFEWQGIAHGGALDGVLVLGRIEVYEPDNLPGSLSDHWTSVPENPNGVGYLVNEKRLSDAFLSLDLYCRPAAFGFVRDVFAAGFATSERGVRLGISLGQPDMKDKGKDYWDTVWRAERWEVMKWEAVLESSIAGYERQ